MKIKFSLLSVLILLAAVLLVSCGATNGADTSGTSAETTPNVTLSAVPVSDIAVSLPSGSHSITEHNGEYLLILPSGADEGKWSFEGTARIDGKVVTGGDAFELQSGKYELETADGSFPVTVQLSENLPSVHITLPEGEIEKVNGSADHSYKASGSASVADADGKAVYSGELKAIRGRGNSTWNGPVKKPYQIEFPEKLSLFGLAEAKKYVLLASYYDRSLLRNTVVMSLADEIFDGYSPASTPVDLFIDGEYYGSYLLCEKIDVSGSRIDITDLEGLMEDSYGDKLDSFERGGDVDGAEPGSYKYYNIPERYIPSDITGGYLLEFDFAERYPAEASGFVTNRGIPVVIKAPEHASRSQVEYIREYVCDFEDALYSEDGRNTKGKHYSEYADMDSLAMRYLLEEYVLNIDGGLSSFYIYKDKGADKMTFSCVWDYDCTLGNYNVHADLTKPDILFLSELETRNAGQAANWFYALMQRDDFKAVVAENYPDFRDAVGKVISDTAEEADRVKASAAADELLYGALADRDSYKANSGLNFDEAYAYLDSFMKERLEFFDTVFAE